MITPTPNNEDVEAFKTLFSGYTEAHGTFEIKTTDPQTGKKSGKAQTMPGAPAISAWQGHLAGAPRGLGAIPLLGDGKSVKWAAIDIDVNDIDHASLEKKVEDLGLPLVVYRSKSGGAHCYLFLQMPCPAKDVVDALRNWSAALGHPGVEIFPKQTKRESDPNTGKPRPGNWINLPYFGGDATERYCVYRGEPISLDKFIELAEDNRSGSGILNNRDKWIFDL